MPEKVYCARCSQECIPLGLGDTGYGTNANGEKICFQCCAYDDKVQMEREGKICLYLVHNVSTSPVCYVKNWPGSLVFQGKVKVGRHNFARTRYDVWFTDHTGARWHGVQYGEWTQICHCRRLTKRS